MALPSSNKTETKRISSVAKQELRDEFTKQNYGQNFHFVETNMPEPLRFIATKHGLKSSQVARQLKAWKDIRYKFKGCVFSNDPNTVRQAIEASHPEDIEGFVIDTIQSMMPSYWRSDDAPCEKPGDLVWLLSACQALESRESVLQLILADSGMLRLFIDRVNQYTTIAVDCFPKTAKMLREGDEQFVRERLSTLRRDLRPRFLQITEKMSRDGLVAATEGGTHSEQQSYSTQEMIGILVNIEDKLFRRWSMCGFRQSLPKIVIPLAVSVHEYSQGVLYYTSGWILNSLSKVKVQGSNNGNLVRERQSMKLLATLHSISKAEADACKLPTEVVDRREMSQLKRSSVDFYNFIRRLEAIYMENLTVDMMLSYSDGSLLQAIHLAIVEDDDTKSQFRSLFGVIVPDDKAFGRVLGYVLRKFRRMRGRWFQKSIVGQTSKGIDAVSKMPTRANVACKSEVACAAASASRGSSTQDNVGCDDVAVMYLEAKQSLLDQNQSQNDSDDSDSESLTTLDDLGDNFDD